MSVTSPNGLADSGEITRAEKRVEELERELAAVREELESYRQSNAMWAEAEADWERNKRLLRTMTENVDDLIAIVDRHGHRVWNNPAYHKILGYTPEELEGTYSMAEVHPEDQAKVMAAFDATMKQGEGRRVEYRMQHKGGHWVSLESLSTSVPDENGQSEWLILIARDISERKKMEEELIRTRQFESVGTFAHGITNDIGEILTAIHGSAIKAIRLNGDTFNSLGQQLTAIEHDVNRGRDVLERLASIVRQQVQSKRLVDLTRLLGELGKNVSKGVPATCRPYFPTAVSKVSVELAPIKEAFLAVLQNAVEADPEGEVLITATNFHVDADPTKRTVPMEPGDYVRVEIRDEGYGMTEKTRLRAFEPYFTTKEGRRGLGLAKALSALQNHDGTLMLESTLGRGTSAFLYLPAAEAPPSAKKKSARLPDVIGLDEEEDEGPELHRVLLMDDEQMILDIVCHMLKHLGYEVKTAKDGAEAIAAFAKSKNLGFHYELVIMDLIIPSGVGGADAVHTIKTMSPDTIVIASSGHSDHPAMLRPQDYGFSGVLHKPYKIDKLQEVITKATEAKA
ncbi:MAG: PAS domain S-box protein [Verrucomicrobiota bacterium]